MSREIQKTIKTKADKTKIVKIARRRRKNKEK